MQFQSDIQMLQIKHYNQASQIATLWETRPDVRTGFHGINFNGFHTELSVDEADGLFKNAEI